MNNPLMKNIIKNTIKALGMMELVSCTRCKEMVPKTRCQVDSKTKGAQTFKCNACNSKMVSLHRNFGAWPTEEFKSWDEEEKAKFYAEIKDMKGRDMINCVEEKMQKRRSDYQDMCSEYGYYPLGYYERRGYDTQEITHHCTFTSFSPHAQVRAQQCCRRWRGRRTGRWR